MVNSVTCMNVGTSLEKAIKGGGKIYSHPYIMSSSMMHKKEENRELAITNILNQLGHEWTITAIKNCHFLHCNHCLLYQINLLNNSKYQKELFWGSFRGRVIYQRKKNEPSVLLLSLGFEKTMFLGYLWWPNLFPHFFFSGIRASGSGLVQGP